MTRKSPPPKEDPPVIESEILDFLAQLNETEDAIDECYTKEVEQRARAVEQMTIEDFEREARQAGMPVIKYMMYSANQVITRQKNRYRKCEQDAKP